MINDRTLKNCSSLMAGTSPQFTIVTANELFDMIDGDLNDGDK